MSKPVHPGEVLLGFIDPYGISQNALARSMGVPPRRINEIVLGKRAITADTAIGLAELLGPSEEFWMRLQAEYELEIARARRGEKPRPVLPPLGPDLGEWDFLDPPVNPLDELLERCRVGQEEPRDRSRRGQAKPRERERRGERVGGSKRGMTSRVMFGEISRGKKR
jgi:antitoxin HigA-1